MSLSIVGLGPGGPEHRTAAAERAVREADVVIGYGPTSTSAPTCSTARK